MLTHLSFSERSKNKCKTFLKLSSQTLYLLDPLINFDVFKFIPRNFTITTKNGFSSFNIDMISDTSPVIAKYIQDNPQNFQYHIEIDDQQNVLGKFEQMYQGKIVSFYENDIPIARQITNFLNISCYPNFLLPTDLYFIEQENIVSINSYCFSQFIKKDTFKTFTIKTFRNEYKCNFFGVCASKIINQFRIENPTKNEYLYEFDDESGEFQLICDLFNFCEVTITGRNMDSLKKISDHLQIENITQKIDDFINNYNKSYYKIDKTQNPIDLITDLFDLLYHIKEKTVEYVKTSIVQSFWCETEENVQELAAFILQVVSTDIVLHRYIADLIEQLNNEANDKNKLKILVPFIVKKLMFLFGETTFNCSFIFNLFKKGFIPKEDIIHQLNSFFIKVKMRMYSPLNLNSEDDSDSDDSTNGDNENLSEFSFTSDCVAFVILWFLPEIIEINKFNETLLEECDDDMISFVQSFLPDKIEDYKKMRDNGEPTDLITKTLRNDDVDSLKSLISDIENAKLDSVPFNIYENFVPNGKTNYLNYSAAYGSIKCFKYLLSKNLKCDDSTLSFAINGGNIEIIKIVDYFYSQQKRDKKENKNEEDNGNDESNAHNDYLIDIKGNANISNYLFYMNYNFNDRDSDLYQIIPSITKHQNNLFEWIFEQKFSIDNKYKNLFNLLLIISAQNGNAYSLILMINFGLKISRKTVNKLFQVSSKKGFYRLSKIIYKTLNKSKSRHYRYYFNCIASISFGNLSIFKFYLNLKKTQKQFEKAFILAVKLDHRNIIEYYFDKLVPSGFKFSPDCVKESMNVSVLREKSDLFFYLIDQFNKTNDSKIDFSEMDQKVLSNACAFNNIECVKTILDSLISSVKNEQGSDFDSSELDLTDHFQTAAVSGSIEICQYFLDKKVSIDFNQLSTSTDELSTVNEEIFSLMLKNSKYIVKQQFLHFYLEPAIENKNFELVEFLLKEKSPCENALFIAVQNDNLKMINLILKYKKNETSFINKSSGIGTALCVAVKRGIAEIVRAILSSPVINPNLCDENGNTPLMLAFPRLDLMNPILDFYGDSILYQTQQIYFLMKKTLHLLNQSEQEAIPILKRILEIKNINPNELINDSNFLFYACKNNNTKILKILLNLNNIDLNIFLPETGDTPLIVAVENNAIDVSEILIKDKRTDINAKNFANKTALSIAFYKKNDKVIDFIFNNENFDPKNGCLDEIFKKVDIEYQKKILSNKSFDVNHLLFTPKKLYRDSLFFEESTEGIDEDNEYKSSETILNYAVRTDNKEIFNFVIQNPSFDKEKSDFKFAICKSIKDGKLDFFKKLLNLINNEINEYDVYQKTLLCCAINYDQIEIVKEILNHPNFDSKLNKMFDNFCTNLISLKQNTFEIMKLLYSYDKEHANLIDLNNISSFGETVFTSINCDTLEMNFLNVDKIVNFLLEKGSDPNKPNKNGKYPLQHAIELSSYEFVFSLLKSNKIDLTKRIKSLNNETFLHLSAILKDSSILNEFLNKNIIDINSVDNQGETPLILACRFHRKDNIKLLFERDNLDFLHCNNQGNDALKIVQIFSGIQEFITTKNKNDYLNQLLDNIGDIEFLPIDIDDSIKQNYYPYLSKSEKIELFKDFHRKSKNEEKSAILHFVDNSSFTNENENRNEEEENLSSYYSSESSSKTMKLYSSSALSNNSSVNDFSNLEGISSVEKNSKRSSSESSSEFLIDFTNNSNEIKSPSQQDDNSNSMKLPSLHINNKSNESSKKQDNSNSNINYSIKQRDEISLHPLNKPVNNCSTKDKISSFNESDQKYSISTIKAQLPDSYLNTSARTMINKIKNLQNKSEQGNAEAQYLLGIFYSVGKGVPVDKEKSFNYYLMAAEQGHMNAQYSAATCYSYGKGTEVDKVKAFELYLKAAEQGFDKAQFAVGHFYEFGQGGVEKNHEIAYEWYQKAANQGHKGSIEALKYK